MCLSSQIYASDHATSPKVWLINFSFLTEKESDLSHQEGQAGIQRHTQHKVLAECPLHSLTLSWKDLQCREDKSLVSCLSASD